MLPDPQVVQKAVELSLVTQRTSSLHDEPAARAKFWVDPPGPQDQSSPTGPLAAERGSRIILSLSLSVRLENSCWFQLAQRVGEVTRVGYLVLAGPGDVLDEVREIM